MITTLHTQYVQAVAAPGLAAAEAVGQPGEERYQEREPEGQSVPRETRGWRCDFCGHGGLRQRWPRVAAAAREDGVRAREGEGARAVGRGRVGEEVRVAEIELSREDGRVREWECWCGGADADAQPELVQEERAVSVQAQPHGRARRELSP